jgi:pimeloyl-ACP methyl ester carboxylesterase
VTAAPLARAQDEVPLYFTAGDNTLFGMLTRPTVEPNGTGVLLLSGGVYVMSTNRNQMFVHLARRLAALGYTVLRIDFRGVGDSGGVISGYELDDPNGEDAAGAMRCLRATGVDEVVVVGSCFGARSGLHAAAGDPALSAMVLFSPPIGDVADGDAPTDADIGPQFTGQLRTLRSRNIPTLIIYGEQDRYFRDFCAALAGPLADLFESGSPFQVATLPGHAHTLHRVASQQQCTDRAVDWLAERADRTVKTVPVETE